MRVSKCLIVAVLIISNFLGRYKDTPDDCIGADCLVINLRER